MLQITCPGCRKTLKVKDELAGKRVKCPACAAPIAVTAPSADDAPPRRRRVVEDEDDDEAPRRKSSDDVEPKPSTLWMIAGSVLGLAGLLMICGGIYLNHENGKKIDDVTFELNGAKSDYADKQFAFKDRNPLFKIEGEKEKIEEAKRMVDSLETQLHDRESAVSRHRLLIVVGGIVLAVGLVVRGYHFFAMMAWRKRNPIAKKKKRKRRDDD